MSGFVIMEGSELFAFCQGYAMHSTATNFPSHPLATLLRAAECAEFFLSAERAERKKQHPFGKTYDLRDLLVSSDPEQRRRATGGEYQMIECMNDAIYFMHSVITHNVSNEVHRNNSESVPLGLTTVVR